MSVRRSGEAPGANRINTKCMRVAICHAIRSVASSSVESASQSIGYSSRSGRCQCQAMSTFQRNTRTVHVRAASHVAFPARARRARASYSTVPYKATPGFISSLASRKLRTEGFAADAHAPSTTMSTSRAALTH